MSDRSTRLLLIYGRMKSSPVTIEMLLEWATKQDLKVSPRTLYRDLQELETSLILPEEKIVVSVGEKNRKTWKIEYLNREPPLNEFDLNSYILFKNFLPLPVVSSRTESLYKIRNIFYKNFSKSHFENFSTIAETQIRSTHFFEGIYFKTYSKILDDCIWSIQNKREIYLDSVNFDYTSMGNNLLFPQSFLPLQLLYHRGVVHLSGYLKNQKKLLVIGLEQIKSYKLTNELFEAMHLLNKSEAELEKRFGITENMTEEIYDIELEFSEFTGTFVKNQFWHQSQVFEQLENGNYLMSMKCGLNRELAGWIFQWMSNVKVRKPKILEDMIIDKYKDILQMYNDDAFVVSNNSFQSSECLTEVDNQST